MLFFLKRYPLTLACLVLIWLLCVVIEMPETPLDGVALIDKWTHFVMYGGTCGVMWWEYLRCHTRLDARRLLLWAVVAPVVMGGVIELVQAYLTTTRSGEWLDWGADAVGVVLGNAIGLLLGRLMRKA